MRILPLTLASATAAALALGSAAPAQADGPDCGTPIHGNLVPYTLCVVDYYYDLIRPGGLPPLPPHTEPPDIPPIG